MIVIHLCEYVKKHWLGYSTWVSSVVFSIEFYEITWNSIELYLNKATFFFFSVSGSEESHLSSNGANAPRSSKPRPGLLPTYVTTYLAPAGIWVCKPGLEVFREHSWSSFPKIHGMLFYFLLETLFLLLTCYMILKPSLLRTSVSP